MLSWVSVQACGCGATVAPPWVRNRISTLSVGGAGLGWGWGVLVDFGTVIPPGCAGGVAGPGRASTHRPGPFCWCRSTVTELMDIVQKFGEDVAVPTNPESEGSRLITLKQIEQEHGIGRSSLHTYRRRPTFPQPVPVEGSTKIVYRADEVAAWFAANPPSQGKRTDLAPQQQGDSAVSGQTTSGLS